LFSLALVRVKLLIVKAGISSGGFSDCNADEFKRKHQSSDKRALYRRSFDFEDENRAKNLQIDRVMDI
jgi:hypothetical protein